jgi:hypothetical protein
MGNASNDSSHFDLKWAFFFVLGLVLRSRRNVQSVVCQLKSPCVHMMFKPHSVLRLQIQEKIFSNETASKTAGRPGIQQVIVAARAKFMFDHTMEHK